MSWISVFTAIELQDCEIFGVWAEVIQYLKNLIFPNSAGRPVARSTQFLPLFSTAAPSLSGHLSTGEFHV